MRKFLGLFALFVIAAISSGRREHYRIAPGNVSGIETRAASIYLAPKPGAYSTRPVSLRLSTPAQSSMQTAPRQLQWLYQLNNWRRLSGLPQVSENLSLNLGSRHHARYLVMQAPAGLAGFRAYDRNIGPAAHREDPGRPSFTPLGAEAAIGGPLRPQIIQGADVSWEGRNQAADIDQLILAPFHRLSLLAPWARIAGYGSFGNYPRRAAALALRGPIDARGGHPVEFPPAGTTISYAALRGGEWPSPESGCGYRLPVGLPITLQTGHQLLLRSYSLRDETTATNVDACAYDRLTYRNPDSVQQKRGQELLAAYGAVILLPRHPLRFGDEYLVTIGAQHRSFEWHFRVDRRPLSPTILSRWKRTATP